MSFQQLLVLVLSVVAACATAVPLGLRDTSPPTVTLDSATVIGKTNGTVTQYLGLPYAQPPYVATYVQFFLADTSYRVVSVGDLRLRPPHTLSSFSGILNATEFGNQ